MIKFHKIRWKNLLSTGNEFTEIDLDKAQTTLIIGENGAGKSTFLEAITYSLFGKPFRNINKPQLVNSMTRKNLVTENEFSIGSNRYKIVRGLRPNIFEIYLNGELFNQSAETKDYQEFLEKHILKVNYKSFCQVVVLGSASYIPFMQLPAGQRRDVIEDLLDLQVFTTMNSLLKDKIYLNNEHIRNNETEKKLIAEKIKLVKKHAKEMEENDQLIIQDRENIITTTLKQIEEVNIKRNQHNKAIEELMPIVKDEKKTAATINQLGKLKQELDLKIESLNKEVQFLNNNTSCPVCTQEINDEFKTKHVHTKSDKIDTITKSMPSLQAKIKQAEECLDNILKTKNIILDHRLQISTLDNQIKMYNEYIERTKKEIDEIKNRVRNTNIDDLTSLEEQYNALEKKLTSLIEESEVLNLTSLMLKDEGIKSKIIKQYVPLMNKFINKYLAALDFFVQFELDENFNETIKSRFRDDFSYESFSEGEKMRLNLAILFAWRSIAKLRNSINTNILVLDEVFDSSLDGNGTDEFMKMIDGLTDGTNAFIISHKTDTIIDKFSNVIRFNKVKNFSKIAV